MHAVLDWQVLFRCIGKLLGSKGQFDNATTFEWINLPNELKDFEYYNFWSSLAVYVTVTTTVL